MHALMAAPISGTHSNFSILVSCAAAKVMVAAIARQTDAANFAAIDLLTVLLRQCWFANAGSYRRPGSRSRPFDPARRHHVTRGRVNAITLPREGAAAVDG